MGKKSQGVETKYYFLHKLSIHCMLGALNITATQVSRLLEQFYHKYVDLWEGEKLAHKGTCSLMNNIQNTCITSPHNSVI